MPRAVVARRGPCVRLFLLAGRSFGIALAVAAGLALPVPQAGSTEGAETRIALAQQPSVVRVFTLRHRRAEEVLLLVRPFLTEDGSVILESKLNTLTIRDTALALDKASQTIASYDVPPRAVSISVALLRAAADSPGSQVKVSDEIRRVGDHLKRVFNLTGYTSLDHVVVEGTEGDAVAYTIGVDYRLEFQLDAVSDDAVVRLRNMVLQRIRHEAGGRERRNDIVRTSVNVPMGQPFVLGLGKDESTSSALFLVFVAQLRGPGPGIVGVR